MRTFHTGGVAGDDITQGLPRVEELFEARRPKKMTTLAEISGEVSVEDAKKANMVTLSITGTEEANDHTTASGERWSVVLPVGSGIRVKNGDHVLKGDRLTDGQYSPHDVLRVLGLDAAHLFLTQEVQKVYRQQGVDINDKHIEVIVRQMMRKVRIEESGDTDLLSGSMVDLTELKRKNAEIRRKNEEPREEGEMPMVPATATRLLMGITKASLATESFLSAASFQETTKVLTEAAMKGKVDHLIGLKENVIIGKLFPAGSGLSVYRDFDLRDVRGGLIGSEESDEGYEAG
jgi:DNA-directed RNA polymerase subunit beta'